MDSDKEIDSVTSKSADTPVSDNVDRSPSPLGIPIRERLKEVFSIEKKLIPYKAFYLSFCAGIGCVLPYVSVFLKQMGLGPEQIGIISGVRPIIGFFSAPLLGFYSDKYGKRKCILLFSVVAWLGFYVALYHTPAAPRRESCPAELKAHRPHKITSRAADLHQTTTRAADLHQTTTLATNPLLDMPMKTKTEQELLKENIYWVYKSGGLNTVFIMTFILIVGGEVFQSPTTALSDAGTLQILGSDRLDDYGAQRAWGSVGWGASSFLAGAVVSSSRKKEDICGVELFFSDYRLLTYVFIGFLVLSFIAATQIKFKEGKDEETIELTGPDGAPKNASAPPAKKNGHSAKAVIRVFLNVHYGSWLATSFFVGVCNGVIWGFLYWHLDNLGADQLLMGVAGTVLCISEFIMFFVVGHVIKIFGHMGIMYAGLVGYAIRFCIYAVIKNPWWVLPAEILQGITFSSVWVSMTAYTTLAVPAASLATIQGILHGVYFGLGSGTGHLIGGIMIGYFGAVITFFSFAGASLVVLLIFVIAQQCSTKPEFSFEYTDLDEEVESTPKTTPTTDSKEQ